MRPKRYFLLIQFRTDASGPHEVSCFSRHGQLTTNQLVVKNIFRDSFTHPAQELEHVAGIILGGSGEFGLVKSPEKLARPLEKLWPILDYALAHNIPTLGACFGHQLIGTHLGAQLVADPEYAESGSFTIRLTEEGQADPLFDGIPNEFTAQVGHQESLLTIPTGATLLATSEQSPIHAYRVSNSVYGVQFHAELTVDDLLFRMRLYPEYIGGKNPDELRELFLESDDAPRVLQNFLRLARAQAS